MKQYIRSFNKCRKFDTSRFYGWRVEVRKKDGTTELIRSVNIIEISFNLVILESFFLNKKVGVNKDTIKSISYCPENTKQKVFIKDE